MFITKSAFLFAFMALCNLVVALPPACLLNVMGAQDNPADLKAICVDNVKDVKSKIEDVCSDEEKAAMKYFANKCSSAGHKVDISTATTSGSSATGTSTGTSTNTGFVTTTASGSSGTSTGSAGGSGSGSGSSFGSGSGSTSNSGSGSGTTSSPSASPTVNSGRSDRQVSAAAFAAVVFVGFAATM